RFTANSAWNGKFSIINHAFEILYKGEASFVSGGGAVEQHWRFDGVEWDFTNTSLRFMSLEITVFDGFTFTFDGELTRTTPGKAVAPVEAIVEKSIVDSLALDTGERETACTVTGTVNFSGNPQLTCSDGAPTTGIGIFGGEWRFTDTEFTWDGRFNISVSGEENQAIVATRTSPDGDSNQVWRFDGIVWNFANTFTRFIAFTGQLTPATLSGEITIPVAGEAVAPIRDIFADERANSRIERQFDPYHRGMFFKTNNYFDNDVFSRGFSYSSGATTSTTPPSVVSNPPGTAYNHAVVGAFLVSPGFNRDEDIHVRAIIRRASTASHIAIADATTAGYASGFIIPAGTGSAQVSAGLLDGTNEVLVSNPVGSSNTHTVYAIEMILRRTGGNITMDWGFNSFSSQSSAFDGNVDPYERFSSTGTITKAFPTTGLAATRWFQVSGGTIIHDLQMFTKHPE
nr:hypothetical protein [Gammaproteobacteria bacterium]